MPAFTSRSTVTFLFAFQLVQVLISWQPDSSRILWVYGGSITKLLSVSNQPADVYHPSQWAPWEGMADFVTQRFMAGSSGVPCGEMGPALNLIWEAAEAGRAECETPGWMASESLQACLCSDVWYLQGLDSWSVLSEAPRMQSFTTPLCASDRWLLRLQVALKHP